jgi:hypothetical protein
VVFWGTPVSSTNKTDHHDITEILLSGIKHHKPNLGVKQQSHSPSLHDKVLVIHLHVTFSSFVIEADNAATSESFPIVRFPYPLTRSFTAATIFPLEFSVATISWSTIKLPILQ